MSKINAIRLININYNNNAIRISDECFHLNGESTLMSLQNGGGKSVLVQMLTAPFVHKRYKDAKDRPFESYFTTSKPSFILVEWALDKGNGFVLTGMMVRKSQEIVENEKENLEIVTIISEYKQPCIQDIYHLPVVEKGKREMILKNFSACKQLFEHYKKDSSMEFFCYDMNNSAQSRQYFDKLMEYQIHYKEWETIIKKVNLKESGLSELFADCKDEKGLVDKWFLEAIQNKLNKGKDRIKEFQHILEQYVGQYKDNRSKIQRRDTIRIFKDKATEIEERAKWYQEADSTLKAQENQIACFIKELNRCQQISQAEYEQIIEKIEEAKREIAKVEYERLSSEFYEYEKDLRFYISNRDMIEMEKEMLEREQLSTEHKIHLLECAKQNEECFEREKELEKARQRLWVFRKKEEDLEPERNKLGYQLKCCYKEKQEETKKKIEERTTELEKILVDIKEKKKEVALLEETIRTLTLKEGSLNTWVETYSQKERRFNKQYNEQLSRNIVGYYEAGALEILQTTYEQQIEQKVRECREEKKNLEQLKEKKKGLDRTLEDKKEEQIWKKTEVKDKQNEYSGYERELKDRAIILKYLNMSEDSLFYEGKILEELERKLVEISTIQKNLEKEENELLKEYKQLTTGQVLELPKEMEEMFASLGINIVYGMEWLKKNGYSEKKNKELVKKNPFLPYALILSKQEFEKMFLYKELIYTSFPIPIILREQLEEDSEKAKNGMIHLSNIHFYVLFNEALLNEKKLKLLLEERQEQQQKKRQAIEIRENEYQEYLERKQVIKNQKVTKDVYEKAKEALQQLEQQVIELEDAQEQIRIQLTETKNSMKEKEVFVRQLEKQVEYQKQQLKDLIVLKEEYSKYEENKRLLEKCQKEKIKSQEKQTLSKELWEQQQEKQKTLETELDILSREQEQIGTSYQKYERYEKIERQIEKAENITELEARYEAITANISQELKELEQQEQEALKWYEKAAEELSYLKKKYRLKQNAWKSVHYNRKELVHQESLLEDCKRKIELKQALWSEEEKKIAVADHKKKECLKQIQKNCQKEEPLSKEKIPEQDFEARKNQLEHQKEQLQKQANEVQKKTQSYDENLTALAEYSEFMVEEKVVWEQSLEKMNQKELRNFKGILVRDYNNGMKERQKCKEQLLDVLQKMLRVELFQEDHYRKPLEAMLEVSNSPEQVLWQLDTTITSYDNLMEKLEIDISIVEKEKEKIIELLEDYTKEVHDNLAKIDQNSTITIRERPIKMLKIQIPNWEENENLYHLRLNDFIDKVTLRGIELFEKNENAQEYFGTQITTRNLYDTAIGLSNVQIRLFKIEAQREYPITWAEVAKNSGGEGFLSAFVILSSLLYYMRKDDSDIFADKNEGKVLLMDNPFAQTNASHLLKPLMDMAKKTNTQLICFTGLGGESIYSRFDNIYILNLIAARLKSGTQYLRVEHLRGNEPDTLELAQIEVREDEERLF